MNKETLFALEESIQHWDENIILAKAGELKQANISADVCSLCDRFIGTCLLTYPDKESEICPVSKKVDYVGCKNTPWTSIYRLLLNLQEKQDNDEIVLRVVEMRDFLISLLPNKYELILGDREQIHE